LNTSTQPKPHDVCVLGHVQTPIAHVPTPQLAPQRPQFFGSERRSVQAVAHAAWPGAGHIGAAPKPAPLLHTLDAAGGGVSFELQPAAIHPTASTHKKP
jgi:hypothetical protein